MTPTYKDELQFVRYGDGSRTGPTVTFRLPDREFLNSFIGREGKRFAAVLIEIGDDETPVEPQQEKPKGGLLAQWCAMRCKEPDFRAWLSEEFGTEDIVDEEVAKKFICSTLHIESRAEIDSNDLTSHLFKRLIMEPWSAHCKANGIGE